MQKLTEKQFEKTIATKLTKLGWFTWKPFDSAKYIDGSFRKDPFQIRGASDLIAIKDGLVVFIEIKLQRGKLSKYQEAFQERITGSGGIYVVIRPDDDLPTILGALIAPI